MRPELNDRQIGRMQFRIRLFQSRGMAEARAERLADRLCDRDTERDDRRCCAECAGLDREHQCIPVRLDRQTRGKRRMPGIPPTFQPMLDTLQRCPAFTFVTP